MRLRWFFPFAVLLPLRLFAADNAVKPRVATITINPSEVITLHLRPEFESTIHMPEEITSVILGSPGSFKAEHNEGEPEYVYVKPITKEAAESNLLIATKSGLHVTLELMSNGIGASGSAMPVDFLIEYRTSRSFLITGSAGAERVRVEPTGTAPTSTQPRIPATAKPIPAIDEEYELQMRVNAPGWTKWEGKQIETSLGDIRQWSNQTVISFSILNASAQPVEVVPPQIQISGRAVKKKEGKSLTADQLLIREYRLSTTRIEAGARADGVVVFDRPNFKQSTEKLFLQIAQADQVDRPILIRLPFTPPIAGRVR
ncbi:hypothetical protein ACOBR2_02130 [Telmatobacter bradus]|uniref:hypothetical protein n=1 Tax=Telmatobacter bradus TaxID=474953 RepID=UPI003B430B21